MGWRDTQAKIESGALNYNRPARSNSDYFFEAATSSFSDAFRSKQAEKAEDKRYARNRSDKLEDEKRADDRALARENETARKNRLEAALAEAKQEEKVIRERRTKAKKLLQQNGRDATNPNFMQFAMDHLQAYGDSYSDAEDKFTELNKRITEVGPMQGPLLRRSDVDLDVSMESMRDAYKDAKDIGDTETQDKIRDTADDLNALGGTMQGGMDKQMDAILGPKGDPATVSGVREALRSGESGGDTEAVDFNKEDGKDHVGLYQFGQARLDDYNNANNTSHTVADLKAMSEEEQEAIADWHFADIETFIDDNGLDKFVGQTVGGVNITRSGLVAMAHLGGNGGMKKFLETDGEYNPDDSSSTVKGNSLAQYAEKFGTSEATTTRSGGLGEGELPVEEYATFEIDPASGNGKKYSDYAKDAYTISRVDQQISIAEADGASEEILSRLRDLKTSMQKQDLEKTMLENGIEPEETVESVYVNEDGQAVVGLVTYDAKTKKAYIWEPGVEKLTEVKNPRRIKEAELKEYNSISTEVQKDTSRFSESAVALTEGLRNANDAVQIAVINPDVLTLGGDFAQLVDGTARNVGSIADVVTDLFSKNGDADITVDQLEQEMRARGMYNGEGSFLDMNENQLVEALIDSNTQKLAQDTSMFEAKMIALAFRVGRLEGQSGNAMSNKDFERITDMLSKSNGNAETFTKLLQNFMNEKIKAYDDEAKSFKDKTPSYDRFLKLYKYAPFDLPKTMDQIVERNGEEELVAAYKFFSGQKELTIQKPTKTSDDGRTNAAEDFRKSPDFTYLKETLPTIKSFTNQAGVTFTAEELREAILETFAKPWGLQMQDMKKIMDLEDKKVEK